MGPETKEGNLLQKLAELMQEFRDAKPNDRGVIDRAYAVTLTDLEKVAAYFEAYAERPAIRAALGYRD